jgi:precorrin-6B methylase 2
MEGVTGGAPTEAEALGRRLADLIGGYQLSAAIGALARVGVADALADGALPVPLLAERVGADPMALRRVLQAVDDAGLFETTDDGAIALTPLGRLLRSDVEGSARRAATSATEEWRWRAYGFVTHSLLTGEPGFRLAHGCGFWDYLENHPAESEWFNAAMSRISAVTGAALAQQYDFTGINRLVDVGGGQGELAQAVLEAHPEMRATLLELPGVAHAAAQRLAATGVADRCEVVAGDFFDSVPSNGDAYVLSWILHDWTDEAAIRILSTCRAAFAEGARLLVIETVVPDSDEPPTPRTAATSRLVKKSDLEMLVVVGGRERTLAEYRLLFGAAGLGLSNVLALTGLPWSVMEAAPRRDISP